MTEKRASYSSSLAFSVASFMSMGVIGLGSSIALARVYGVTVIGQYALVLSVSVFAMVFATIREQTALIRDLSVLEHRDPRATGRFYAVLSFSSVLTAVVGGIALLVAALLFRGPIDQPTLVTATVVIVLGHHKAVARTRGDQQLAVGLVNEQIHDLRLIGQIHHKSQRLAHAPPHRAGWTRTPCRTARWSRTPTADPWSPHGK